jgi:SNF2 family DNA or RNA helicase
VDEFCKRQALTTLQNSIDELYALIRFLKIPPYNVWGKFSSEISRLLKTKEDHLHKRAMGRVQAVLKSIMLRRGKTTIVDGKQICEYVHTIRRKCMGDTLFA